MQVEPEQAREAVLDLWRGVDLSRYRGEPLRVPIDSWRTVKTACDDLATVSTGRVSPDGLPMDLIAPSVWHAASFLTASNLESRRLSGSSADDVDLFENAFGNQHVYRGQARPWHITPTAWRKSGDFHRTSMATRLFLESVMGEEDAIELDLFGRMRTDADAACIAQHYGIPTSLVDFTFDPFVALFFSLSGAESAVPEIANVPAGTAVVYMTSVYKLISVGQLVLHFPPVQARRLWRQSGFLVDYGERPALVPSELDYEKPWMHLEENCVRLFVHRIYPDEPAAADFNIASILTPDIFFEQVVSAAAEFGATAHPLSFAVEFIRTRVHERPPWRIKSLDGAFVYTDDEFSVIARVIARYLAMAALIQINGRTHLDPVVLSKIGEHDKDVLLGLKQMTQVPMGLHGEFDWLVKEIGDAFHRVQRYVQCNAP